jgi:hypothetical protein
MKIKHYILLAAVAACQVLTLELSAQDTRWSPEHVYYGSGGKLAYAPDEQGNIIPDFSHVGYMYGDESIPDIPVAIEVSPVEGDDGANIQAAINLVAAMAPDENGFKGAVLLKQGTYEVEGQLFIRSGGVVLRGEGQTEDGTVIVAAGTGKRDFIVIGNGSGFNVSSASKVDIIEPYVPVGRKYVVVSDGSGFSKGGRISIYRPGTENWIHDLKMDQIPDPDGSTSQWKPSGYSFHFERLVTRVSGDTIFFRNPIVMAMETIYGGGAVYQSTPDRIVKVGIEDLLLKSAYKHETDEDHAWKAVVFNGVEHAWARRITSMYFGYACVSVETAARSITVEDCHSRDPKSVITGGRRYSFNLSGSLALFKDCSTTEGRHDYVTGSRVRGPNVFTNCTASNVHADAGPHHRWAMGSLYDIIVTDGAINVQDRGASGSGHGWAGANQVFWNCTGASSICQNPWVSANNYNFGFIGEKNPGWNSRPDGIWVGQNRPGILPESLYQAQLDSRQNNELIFSAYPSLEKINDSTFILSLNMPFPNSFAKPNNFSIAGNAGFEEAEFSVTSLSDTSVIVGFNSIGPLPAFSSVIVNIDNMLSITGKPLQGLSAAMYFEPDLRPVVSGASDKVNNEDGFLTASSSKPGMIYLVEFVVENYQNGYTSVCELDHAVAENRGRKVDAPYADSTVVISTEGLPGGYYNYYAVDQDGRMSERANQWPEVEATGPVLEVGDKVTPTGFSIWCSKETIYIQPKNYSTTYSAHFFDITGRLINVRHQMVGEQHLMIPDYQGILIVKFTTENGLHIGAYKLLHSRSR